MHTWYLLSVFFHIVAATIWVGGTFSIALVVVPFLRTGDRRTAANAMRVMGTRLRDIGWGCFALLAVTGSFNAWVRGVRLSSFGDPIFLGSPFGRAFLAKLGVFAAILAVSAFHDFVLGPRSARLVAGDPASPAAEHARRMASWLGRVNALLALATIAVAVTLVRGLP